MRIARITAIVLGSIGSVWDLLFGFALWVVSGITLFGGPSFESKTLGDLGLAQLLLGVLGFVGVALVPFSPKAGAWCMGISAVGYLIAISVAYITVTAAGASMSFTPQLEICVHTRCSSSPYPLSQYIIGPLYLGVATVMAIAGRKEQ